MHTLLKGPAQISMLILAIGGQSICCSATKYTSTSMVFSVNQRSCWISQPAYQHEPIIVGLFNWVLLPIAYKDYVLTTLPCMLL